MDSRVKSLQLCGPHGVIARNVVVASTFLSRLRGLLGRSRFAPDDAIVLKPCTQIHTLGLGFPIDAIFCDDDLRVVYVETVARRRLSRRVRGAACCIELASGRASDCGIEPGVRLELRDAS
jgi:uncharacterized membrane protein (UPF0127 family)